MRPSSIQSLAGLSLLAFASAQGYGQGNSSLPIVDLGYELHQASYFNSTGQFYNFSNIRYAAPPLGELRFTAPQPPAVNRSGVQTGSVGRICPQANPAWELIAQKFIPAYLEGIPYNASASGSSNSTSQLPPQDPRTTEDCLFLDVVVPQQVFESAGQGYGAPVLVWIYGGGYTGGEKAGSGSVAGLLATSGTVSGGEQVIYVAMNYRLGAFGWLGGPTLQANGTANAGLLDQRMALEWVQQYIHLFGGDPNRVTVFGESAGGGSVMHQITAYGGLKGPVPFQQAIPQSPGFRPVFSNQAKESTLQTFLSLLSVKTIQEARQLPSQSLINANAIQVGLYSVYGDFTYGPTVDGDFVPALPGELLARGQFDKSVRIMAGHNADEGLDFTPPFITNDTAFSSYLRATMPTISDAALKTITQDLYPPVFDGSMPYKDNIGRASLAISESIFTCNTYYLANAYGNRTYAYLFAIPPALHGQDVAYTYYNGGSGVNATVAHALQGFITSFAEMGRPLGGTAGVPYFQMYGNNATIMDLNATSIMETMDPTANARCDWWQKALYI